MFKMIDLEDGLSQRRHLEQVWFRTDIATDETDSHTTEQCKQTEFEKPLSIWKGHINQLMEVNDGSDTR